MSLNSRIMSSTSGNVDIGPGIIIIASVCSLCLVLSIVLSRLDGGAKLAGLGLIPVAVIVSLGLWFAPQETLGEQEVVDVKKYDPGYYARYLILAMMSISFLTAMLLYAVFHILEPIYAKPLKKSVY